MVIIKFPSREIERHAIGYLAGRFSSRVFKSGEVIVPEPALEALAGSGFSFTVIGKASYEQMASLRGPAAAPVQRRKARARSVDR